MDTNEFTNAFVHLYRELYTRLHTRWPKDEYRPSPETLAVLCHLEYSGPMTVSEAALHFDRAQSAMSELFERILEHGLIARVRDGRDKRRSLIWLTDSGLALLRRSESVLDHDMFYQCAIQLSPETRTQLAQHLTALLTAAKKISTNPPGAHGDAPSP
ncbi:MAG: MarR family winged helix-turn-helix transcriptional regulator [Pseudomonadota bacterium]